MNLLAAYVVSVSGQGATSPWVIGIEQLHRLDLLPAYKRAIRIGSVTSYDRSGGNDDGFSGKYSFVRKEGENLVLADLVGPGCIYRIHTPTPTDDILDVIFDGESTPRISMPVRDFFSGKFAPFLRPLVDYAGGGYYSYVPLPYRKSCKLLLHAKSFQFYDLNYAQYAPGAAVTTYDPVAASGRNYWRAADVFNLGSRTPITEYTTPAGSKTSTRNFAGQLQPGSATTIFESNRGGRILGIKLGPADAFVGKARDLYLRMTWDGDKHPAVLCPVGDFFGYGWGRPATGSRLVGTRDGTNYCFLPMPFAKNAKVELVSLRSTAEPVEFRGTVTVGDIPRRPWEGAFFARWNRENPTTPGMDFTFFESPGKGHIVGLALQAQGKEAGSTGFFEGDDQTVVDGKMAIHGTGSEDFFNGGWYDVPDRWDGPVARALSGCMTYQKPLGRTGAYRFFIGDAYSYVSSIRQVIEHGGDRSDVPADYCSMTYLYASHNPATTSSIPDTKTRMVSDPQQIIFSAHWTLPISSFSFRQATVSRRDVPAAGGQTRCLSFRAPYDDFFGPPFISFVCDLPAAGRYRVFADVVKGPEQAQVQLFRDESPVAAPVEFYAEKPILVSAVPLGEVVATDGPNRIMFKLVGSDPRAKTKGFDIVNLIFKRVI